VGDGKVNVVYILLKKFLVLLEIEEAHVHELAKSSFCLSWKVGVLLAFKFHAVLDFGQIFLLVLDG